MIGATAADANPVPAMQSSAVVSSTNRRPMPDTSTGGVQLLLP
jgi:hypothetical protein